MRLGLGARLADAGAGYKVGPTDVQRVACVAVCRVVVQDYHATYT